MRPSRLKNTRADRAGHQKKRAVPTGPLHRREDLLARHLRERPGGSQRGRARFRGPQLLGQVVNRKEFGLAWNQTLETGGVLVAEKVEIEIELQARELRCASPASPGARASLLVE